MRGEKVLAFGVLLGLFFAAVAMAFAQGRGDPEAQRLMDEENALGHFLPRFFGVSYLDPPAFPGLDGALDRALRAIEEEGSFS